EGLQNCLSISNDNRHFLCLHLESVQQLLRSLVGVEIDVGVGMRIAAKKLANPEGIGAVAGAYHNEVAESAADQRKPAQDKRPHENFAQFSVGSNHLAQTI